CVGRSVAPRDLRPFPTRRSSDLDYPALHFWVHGGAAGGQQLRVIVQHDDAVVADAELDDLIQGGAIAAGEWREIGVMFAAPPLRSEEHTSELQSRENLVCRLLLE